VIGAGSVSKARIFGPLPRLGRMLLAGRLRRRPTMAFFVAKLNSADMAVLGDLMESGKVKPVVERTYPLSETGDALRYLGEGHARGKIVLTV
jgi:NADPH:quinone reductase-like Zn-dependent oxidoreductase